MLNFFFPQQQISTMIKTYKYIGIRIKVCNNTNDYHNNLTSIQCGKLLITSGAKPSVFQHGH